MRQGKAVTDGSLITETKVVDQVRTDKNKNMYNNGNIIDNYNNGNNNYNNGNMGHPVPLPPDICCSFSVRSHLATNMYIYIYI